MAKKKVNYKGMSKGELERELTTLRENLRQSRFKTEGSKSKNVKEQREMKKGIARILTETNLLKDETNKKQK